MCAGIIITMLGYIGLSLLLLAYITMLTKKAWLFVVINCIASVLLTVHAILIQDVPFIIVNGFVVIVLSISFWKDRVWQHFIKNKENNNA